MMEKQPPFGRNELYSDKVVTGKRTYYIDVKQTSTGTMCLVLSESRMFGADTKRRDRVMIFEEDLENVWESLRNAMEYISTRS